MTVDFFVGVGDGSELVLEMVLKLTQMSKQDNQQKQKTSEFVTYCSE
jgi:hypothetical protein